MITALLIFILVLTNFLFRDGNLLFQVNFVLLVCYLFYVFSKEKSFFRLIYLWVGAFLLLIIPDGLFYFDSLVTRFGQDKVLEAGIFLINSNWMVVAFYCLYPKKTTSLEKEKSNIFEIKEGQLTFFLIISLLLLYLYFGSSFALKVFFQGRVSKGGGDRGIFSAFASIIRTVGLVLPAIISYYYKYVKKEVSPLKNSFLLSAPIFILIFMGGTRFPLLFAFGGFLIVLYGDGEIKAKQILTVLLAGVILLSVNNLMLSFRTWGINKSPTELKVEKESNLIKSEGVLESVVMLVDYFETEDYYYGKSSSTLLVFWIPRFFWPSKPTFLGYWFVRKYLGESKVDRGHTISFSFAGDAYVDFGLYGGILFCSIFGVLLGKFEQFNIKLLNSNNKINMILLSIIYPFTFFAVRSISTAFFVLVGSYFMFRLFKFTLIIKENDSGK